MPDFSVPASMRGVAGALGATRPDSRVLFDDWFDEGQCGWHQLYDSNIPRGVLGLTNLPAMRHRSLVLSTEHQRNGTASSYPWGRCMAIKRMTRPRDAGVVRFEVWWAMRPQGGKDRLGDIEFGIDTANGNAVRRFYKFVWQNWDGTSGTRQSRWSVYDNSVERIIFQSVNTADLTNNPSDSFLVPYNEGKPLFVYTVIEADVANDHYRGVAVEGMGAGSLDNPPDTSLYSYTGDDQGSLTGFTNGLNFAVTLHNRSDIDHTAATVFLGRARATLLG